MVKPKELVRHELIGLDVEIVGSSNLVMIGVKGKVVDESRNTLTIQTNLGPRTAVKDQCTFRFRLPSGRQVRIKGELILGRPEDRIKKKIKKW